MEEVCQREFQGRNEVSDRVANLELDPDHRQLDRWLGKQPTEHLECMAVVWSWTTSFFRSHSTSRSQKFCRLQCFRHLFHHLLHDDEGQVSDVPSKMPLSYTAITYLSSSLVWQCQCHPSM